MINISGLNMAYKYDILTACDHDFVCHMSWSVFQQNFLAKLKLLSLLLNFSVIVAAFREFE